MTSTNVNTISQAKKNHPVAHAIPRTAFFMQAGSLESNSLSILNHQRDCADQYMTIGKYYGRVLHSEAQLY